MIMKTSTKSTIPSREDQLKQIREDSEFRATPIGRALHLFEQATIRAWVCDTQDDQTDRSRRVTSHAHLEAKERKRELIDLIKKVQR
jgi:hypothetical protein